jgi:DNA-binding Lrp family transcriptional regulator
MTTVSQAAQTLGLSRDQLHYVIKKCQKQGLMEKPLKKGNRFLLSDEDIEKLGRELQEKIKPMGAILLVRVPGTRTAEAVNTLKERFPQVVWVAGAWGDSSVIALLEAPKFETIASIPFELEKTLDYVNDTRTCMIPSVHYYVKETSPAARDQLAVILINVAKSVEQSSRDTLRVVEDLHDIPEVKRYGAMLGQWDAFAEVRYQNADALPDIVLNKIYKIRGVYNTTSILTMRKFRHQRPFIPQASSEAGA